MHFMEVGPWQGLKPAANPEHLRGAEASLFHGEAVLLAFFSNLLVYNLSHKGFWGRARLQPCRHEPLSERALAPEGLLQNVENHL